MLNLPHFSFTRPLLEAPNADTIRVAAELRRDVEILASDIGPRGTFAPDRYDLAREFIISALQHAGHSPSLHTWTTMDVACSNIEITIRGTLRPDDLYVVGAHYDSVGGCPAANDNASGVAGLLWLARTLANHPPASTMRLVFFANEEPPFFSMNEMGSQIDAKRCIAAGWNVRGMCCLETIGCYSTAPGSQQWPNAILNTMLPSTGDFVAFIGPTNSVPFLNRMSAAFEASRAFPLLSAAVPGEWVEQVNWSDHRGFNEVGIPAFMVTDTAPLRYEHYHTPADTAEKLDYVSMARVMTGIGAALRGI